MGERGGAGPVSAHQSLQDKPGDAAPTTRRGKRRRLGHCLSLGKGARFEPSSMCSRSTDADEMSADDVDREQKAIQESASRPILESRKGRRFLI